MAPMQNNLVFDTSEARERGSSLPVSQRQRLIRDMRVPYATYNRGLALISRLHRPLEDGIPSVGVIGGLLGDPGSGKSAICEAYLNRFPPRDGDTGREFPVLYIDASLGGSLKRLGFKIQKATESPHRIMSREDPIEWSVDRLLKCKTELLILDDAHFMFFNQRTSQVAAELYGFVKDVVDTKKIAVLLVGEADIDTYVHDIPAFRRRGYRSDVLFPLTNDPEDLASFGDLLTSIDRRLPFREPSKLKNHADHFHRFSGGQIGLVMNVVIEAANLALAARTACILTEHLREAVRPMVAPGDDTDYFGYKKALRNKLDRRK